MTYPISRYDIACKALVEAKTLTEVKDISDKAAAIQEYARRAKNRNLEIDAVELRVRAERKLGAMLREMPKATGARGGGKKESPRGSYVESRDSTPTLSDIGISKKLSFRAQKLAEQSSEKFETNICNWREHSQKEKEKLSVDRLLRGDWYQTSESPEWETPQWLFDLLDNEFHFSLDVCASEVNHKCEKYYSKADDGLSKDWDGICWMNPPYGREIKDWLRKARIESENGVTVVCLVPARTDTEWWWENCIQGEIRFIRGRLHFSPGSDTAAPFPSAIVILGRNIQSKVVWWNVQNT